MMSTIALINFCRCAAVPVGQPPSDGSHGALGHRRQRGLPVLSEEVIICAICVLLRGCLR